FGELTAADALRLEQGAVAGVDVLQLAVGHERAELLMVGIEQLVINDFGEDAFLLGQPLQFVELGERKDRRLLDQYVLACFDCRLSGVATKTKSTPCLSSRPIESGSLKLSKRAMRSPADWR